MTVENLGFFREFPHGDAGGPSLLDCVAKGDARIKGLIAGYLEQGAVLATTGQRVFDVLSDEKHDAGSLAIITDGVWMWPGDLAYYVRKYNIALPESFVGHAESLNWTPPELSRSELLLIEEGMLTE
ncbi:hypothetical protein ACIOJE_25380 [Kitasatospora sp. NPDC087861]|uniref:hypothetical protein n=1 Tax=Kitasatospora sp. NPDC087861 TaxID=3364070 RepID=UPI003817EB95